MTSCTSPGTGSAGCVGGLGSTEAPFGTGRGAEIRRLSELVSSSWHLSIPGGGARCWPCDSGREGGWTTASTSVGPTRANGWPYVAGAARGSRCPVAPSQPPTERWAMDFMRDTLRGNRAFRLLNTLNHLHREWVAIEVDVSLGGNGGAYPHTPWRVPTAPPRAILVESSTRRRLTRGQTPAA